MILLRLPLMLAILLYQSILLAIGQIWANKLRSILTTIGIVIGVASVTLVIGALTGLQAAVLADMESFGTNKIFISPDWPSGTGPLKNARWRLIRYKPELFTDMLQHCSALSAYYCRVDNSYTTSPPALSPRITSMSSASIPPGTRSSCRTVIAGRELNFIDEDEERPVCLINEALRRPSSIAPCACVGGSIQIGNRRYIIVGILQKPADSELFGPMGSDSEVIVPFSCLYNNYSWIQITAAAQSASANPSKLSRKLNFILRQARHISASGDEDECFPRRLQPERAAWAEQVNSIILVITEVATGLVGVSLIVGGVGIMNIMLVSVSERTREIGLRKAVGARPAAILMQFLVEAITLCFFGGAIGVAMGIGLTYFARTLPIHLQKAAVPLWAIALSFGFAASVGLIFGMFPAIKASRLDPIEAIRHE